MSTVLERAHAAEQRQQAEALQAYNDLVVAAVVGTDDVNLDPTPILRAAGKTAADLASAVQSKLYRNELRRKIADAKGTAARRAEIMQQMEESAEKLRAEEQRHLEFCQPLHHELSDFNDRLMQVSAWEQDLRNSADPAIRQQLQVLDARIGHINNQIFQLEHSSGRDRQAALSQKMEERAALVSEKDKLARRQLED